MVIGVMGNSVHDIEDSHAAPLGVLHDTTVPLGKSDRLAPIAKGTLQRPERRL
jgi:hypothetical protein